MAKQKQNTTPINEATVGELIHAASEGWSLAFQKLNMAQLLCGHVADCVERDDMAALKRLLPKIKEAAQ